MARNLHGPIPDDYFENDPIYPPRNYPPLSKECLEWIKRLKDLVERLRDHGTDKYRPGDVVSGY
jgi:hypothetical protein